MITSSLGDALGKRIGNMKICILRNSEFGMGPLFPVPIQSMSNSAVTS